MTTHPSAVLFETAIGSCGVHWSAAGLTGILLPSARTASGTWLRDRPDVPESVRHSIVRIAAVLDGSHDDLLDISLDERGIDPFRRAVYAATRRISPGSTTSYGRVARSIDCPDAAREVGAALARNPFPIVVPCHRVLAADGALTGFSAPGGVATKRRMLEIEGAPGFGQLALFG